MIYFIYGEDSYRSKRKLEEIVSGYKKVHKSGLNLIYINAKEKDFKDFNSGLKINSMFDEKKLIVLDNIFEDEKFQKDFLDNIENLKDIKDIVIIYEEGVPDKRTKFFKSLQKHAKCQDFDYLAPAMLKRWVTQEFENHGAKVDPAAIQILIDFVGNDLWRMSNEVNKLSNYKMGSTVKKEDVELLIRPNIENDIFKTIDALVSKNKSQALSLLHKHLENGDNALYLLSMISYQFRNLLVIRELQDMQQPYGYVMKKSGLHPFVAQKSYYLSQQFSMLKLKKIYQKIFQIDSDIKTGKIEPETALDLLLVEI